MEAGGGATPAADGGGGNAASANCAEVQDDCTTACEAKDARSYRVVATAGALGVACVGPADCAPGDGMCGAPVVVRDEQGEDKAGTTAPSTGLLPGQEAGDVACGNIKCALDCEDECGWSTAAATCVSATTGARTSAKEKDARLGDCAPAAPAETVAGGGDDSDGGMTIIGIAVALVVFACAAGGVFAYVKWGKEEQVMALGAAYNNPAYTQPAFASPALASQEDGELYEVQHGTDGHTYQDTYSMEKAPGVQGSAGQALQQFQGQDGTYDLGHESTGQQQAQGQEGTYDLGHEPTGQQQAQGQEGTYDLGHAPAGQQGYLDVAGSSTAKTAIPSYDYSTDDEEI